MKKALIFVLAILFALGFTATAFGAVPFGTGATGKFTAHKSFKHKQCDLKDVIKESMKKNNGDLAKVKEDVAKHFEQKSALHQSRLQEKAKEKGVSVEELKAQMAAKRQGMLEKKAKKQNVTVEELKQKMLTKHQQKAEAMAKELGISVEQLMQILPQHGAKK